MTIKQKNKLLVKTLQDICKTTLDKKRVTFLNVLELGILINCEETLKKVKK